MRNRESHKYAITCALLHKKSQSCRCCVCGHIKMHLSGFLNRQALFKHSGETSRENSSSFIFISLSLPQTHLVALTCRQSCIRIFWTAGSIYSLCPHKQTKLHSSFCFSWSSFLYISNHNKYIYISFLFYTKIELHEKLNEDWSLLIMLKINDTDRAM